MRLFLALLLGRVARRCLGECGEELDALLLGLRPTVEALAALDSLKSKDLAARFQEIIAPGAFEKVVSDADEDTRALFNHDRHRVLGRRAHELAQQYEYSRAVSRYAEGLRALVGASEAVA